MSGDVAVALLKGDERKLLLCRFRLSSFCLSFNIDILLFKLVN
jgi:hypothetical protein